MFDMATVSYAELESKIKAPIAIECREQEKDSQLIDRLDDIEQAVLKITEKLQSIEKTNKLALKAYEVMKGNLQSINERLYLHEMRIQNLEVKNILPWQRS